MGKIQAAIHGEEPLMSEAPDTNVTLFRGVYAGSDWNQQATVKELTGSDEEYIARMMGGSNPTLYLNAVLSYGVETLGTYDLPKLGVSERMALIDSLLVGEKELLFLNILRVTYGDVRTVPVKCPSCQAVNDVSFSITDDVPIRTLDDPFAPAYEFTCRNGDNLMYRLVNGADQAASTQKPQATMPEQNTILISRAITTINGRPLVDPLHFARELGALDRRNLLEALLSKQPGPYFEEVKLPCATCGAESLFTPTWADLL
jgi:hypothetical protein